MTPVTCSDDGRHALGTNLMIAGTRSKAGGRVKSLQHSTQEHNMSMKKSIYIFVCAALLLTACAGAAPTAAVSQPAATPGLVVTSPAASLPAGQPAPTQQASPAQPAANLTYPIVDTGQGKCYDNSVEMTCSQTSFFGQDAQYTSHAPGYSLSADGLTVNDLVTGLTWQRSPETNGDGALNKSDKLTLAQAQALPAQLNAANFGGYSDWRLPSIKELYSLIDFRGTDPSVGSGTVQLIPFIDTTYFQFVYGDAQSGERTIDSQYASGTVYVGPSSRGGQKLFGVNFADGRIKGYDLSMPGGAEKTFFVICVRGNPQYGQNAFQDNGDQTISDAATGLTWAKADSGSAMNWQQALSWVQAQNAANYLGHNDWRLPDIKELQSIVDYSRSPDASASAAIDPLFESTRLSNEADQEDYPFYWSGSTHAGSTGKGETADYMAFGRALGYMDSAWVDVHGAGAQRSDPKSGDAAQFPQGRGPQGDAIRIQNYVRLVRGGQVTLTLDGNPSATLPSMTVEVTGVQQTGPGGSGTNGQSGGLPGGMGGTPPQAAISACSASSQGAACSFTSPNGLVSGACQTIQQVLACVPANRP